jgi:DNA-binding NtrC family response regulator
VKTIRVDVRLVAATNSDLKKEIQSATFREDLYYRLNVVPIRLASLRERAEDIPLLVQHFIAKFNERLHKTVVRTDGGAEGLLSVYPWPGNIRELENVIERAVLFCDQHELSSADLPAEVRGSSASSPPSPAPQKAVDTPVGQDGLKERVKAAMVRLERELIVRALDQTNNNVTHAARLLKISRKGLQLKMKELGLRERDERPD